MNIDELRKLVNQIRDADEDILQCEQRMQALCSVLETVNDLIERFCTAFYETYSEQIAALVESCIEYIKEHYTDSDCAINIVLVLHKNLKVLIKKYKRIYMRQKIP